MLFRILLLWALVVSTVTGQFIAPTSFSSWRKPNVTTSPEDRVSIAQAALEKGVSALGNSWEFANHSYGAPGTFYGQLVEWDLLTNQSRYKDQLKSWLPQADKARPGFLDEFYHGYAAARAYAAYHDATFLNYAVEAWTSASLYTLSEGNVNSGSMPTKNFTIATDCDGGKSMAGGTFARTDKDSADLDGPATGNFLVLSALLAELTSNKTYLDAATQSKDFILAHLYNFENVVLHTISGSRNDSCSKGNQEIDSWDSGLMIEGLAILMSITQDVSIQAKLIDTISFALNNSAWQGANGIVANSGKNGDLYIVRGLAAAYNRNATPSDVHSYLGSYLGVQYNAVLDQATEGNTNIYGSSWLGSPPIQFDPNNQTNSMAALLAAIPLRNDSSTVSSPSPSPTVSPSPIPNKKSHLTPRAIAGTVVGSLAFISITGLVVWFGIRRRRQRRRFQVDRVNAWSKEALPDPFTATVIPLPSEVRQREESSSSGIPLKSNRRNGAPRVATVGKAPHNSMAVNEPSPPEPGSSGSSSTPASDAVVYQAPEASGRNDAEMSVGELVRLLNQRLQPGQWREEEMPPTYREELTGDHA